jgi:hypothetical protein
MMGTAIANPVAIKGRQEAPGTGDPNAQVRILAIHYPILQQQYLLSYRTLDMLTE